jgi:hypothetical protein
MDVNEDAGVGSRIGTRELDSRRVRGTRAGNRHLVAAHVELSTTGGASDMEGND